MKIQIGFFLNDLHKNLFKILMTTLQLIIVMFLFTYTFDRLDALKKVVDKMEYISEDINIYTYDEISTESEFKSLIQDEKLDAFIQAEKEISDLGYKKYIMDFGRQMMFSDNVKIPNSSIKRVFNGNFYLDRIEVSNSFFDIFDIELHFEEVEGTYIPVIVGHDFSKYYQVGDIIDSGYGQQYIVQGIIPKGELGVAPINSDEIIQLDQHIITLFDEESREIFSHVFTIFGTYYVIDDNQNPDVIADIYYKYGLFNLRPRSFDDKIEHMKDTKYEEFLIFATIGGLVFVMSLIGLVANLIQFLSEHNLEFSIHMLCGARSNDLILRTSYQIISIVVLSNIANLCVFGINSGSIITGIFSVILGMCIMIYPIWFVKSQNIMVTIRKEIE